MLTGFGFIAWTIMVETKMESTALGIAVYSLGGALGTWLSFRRKTPKMPPPQVQTPPAL